MNAIYYEIIRSTADVPKNHHYLKFMHVVVWDKKSWLLTIIFFFDHDPIVDVI